MATNPGHGVIIVPTQEQCDEAIRRSGNKNPKPLLRFAIQKLVEEYGLKLLDLLPANLQPRRLASPQPQAQPQPLSASTPDPVVNLSELAASVPEIDLSELDSRVLALLKTKTKAMLEDKLPKPPESPKPPKVLKPMPEPPIPVCYLLDKEFEENFNHAFAECEPHVTEFYTKTNMIRMPLHEVANTVHRFASPDFGPGPRTPTEKNWSNLIYAAYRIWWIHTYGDKTKIH